VDKQEQMIGLLEKAQAIVDGAKDRNLTDEEHEQATKFIADAMQVRDEIKTDRRDDELKASLGKLLGDMQKGEPQPQPQQPKGTLGERFLADAAWQAWKKSVAPTGQFSTGRLGMSPAVMVKSFGLWAKAMGRKDLITGLDSTSAGAFVVAEDTGIYEQIGRYPTVLRDLISVRQTTTDVVEYVRQTAQVTQAAPTAEANVKTVSGATGEISGEKPQGAIAFERVSETVKTIAVYVGATKRALSDASQIRGIIDQELREDLVDCLEDQLFNGNGVGENFTGLANQAGTLVQAFNTDILTTTRQALTTLLVTGRQIPTAWAFSPTDWETVELFRAGVMTSPRRG